MFCVQKGVFKTAKVFKIISKTLSTVVVAVVVLLAVLLVGVRLFGVTPYTVLSGSMEPHYHVGSIIYVSDVDPFEIKVNDPITYHMSSGTVVTHRVVEVLNEGTPELAFKTKGDANKDADGTPVPASAVIGKPQFSIPYLGYVSDYVQKPQGLITVVGAGVVLFIISSVIDALFKNEKDKPSDPDSKEQTEAVDNTAE